MTDDTQSAAVEAAPVTTESPTQSATAAPATASPAGESAGAPPIKTHLRAILSETLAELGKLELFAEEELEKFWKLVSAKL